jgi:uncharacterized membrane protein YbhN (UPF0104 family)
VSGLTLAFFAVLIYLAWRYARTIAWQDVQQALADTPTPALLAASVMAAISHAIYSCFDLLGRAYTRHRLRAVQVLGITFISYAFNLTLGSLVGGIGMRLRLYTRLGLSALTVTRVFIFSIVTNWFGFLVLAGAVFALAPPPVGTDWSSPALRALGLGLLTLAGGYAAVCLRTRQRRRLLRLFRNWRCPAPTGPARGLSCTSCCRRSWTICRCWACCWWRRSQACSHTSPPAWACWRRCSSPCCRIPCRCTSC